MLLQITDYRFDIRLKFGNIRLELDNYLASKESQMAKLGSASLTGQVSASVRGGSNLLGAKSVVFATISKDGVVSSPIQSFENPRGKRFSDFLNSFKGGNEGGAVPLFPFQELSVKQSESIKSAKNNSVNVEPATSQPPSIRENKPTVIWFGPALPNQISERGAEVGQSTILEKKCKV